MKNKFIVKICILLCVGIIVFTNFSSVYALSDLIDRLGGKTGSFTENMESGDWEKVEEEITNPLKNKNKANSIVDNAKGKSFLSNIFSQGGSFFNPTAPNANATSELGSEINTALKDLGIIQAVRLVGNLVFIIITCILGIKYIFAGSAEKADIKNSLVTLSVAIVFFFLAQAVYDFSSGVMVDVLGNGTPTYTSIEGKIWSTVTVVVNMCALLGVILIGIKYMLASANTRADLKKELVPVVVGLILVYSTVNVIQFIVDVGDALL